MTKHLRWLLAACVLAVFTPVISASEPNDFFEVMTVNPSRVIKHDVETKGPFDVDAMKTLLRGPQLFAQTVGQEEGAVTSPRAYLNWYEIVQAPDEPRRAVSVSDSLQGKRQVTLGNCAFLLSPAQRITTGEPSPIPDDLNYFKAYRILDARRIQKEVILSGTLGPAGRTATRALFLCVPVQQLHHGELFDIKSPQECLLVYDGIPHKHAAGLTTIDQFGINNLETQSSTWLCVRATIGELIRKGDE